MLDELNAFLDDCSTISTVIKSIPGDFLRGKDFIKYCTSPGEKDFGAR